MTTNRIQPVQVTIGRGYDVGRKRAHKPNQDYVGYYADITPDEEDLTRKGLLYIVADGMGGAAGGELASRMAVDITLSKYYQDEELNVGNSLAKAVQSANQQIHERGHNDPASWGMGTTIVAAVLRGNQLNVLNVGDSRAYLLRKQKITQISIDHSLVQEQVRARLLTPEEAAVHPRRNVLSRNLGYAPQTYPDLTKKTLRKRDILLLCSDGLWGQVSDAELAHYLHYYEPQDAADKLVDLANERGGPDNISVIVLRVDNLLIEDDDDEITDPTPLLAKTEELIKDEDTDPTFFLQATNKIKIPTSDHRFDIGRDNDGPHLSSSRTTRQLSPIDTIVAPDDYDQLEAEVPRSSAYNQPEPPATPQPVYSQTQPPAASPPAYNQAQRPATRPLANSQTQRPATRPPVYSQPEPPAASQPAYSQPEPPAAPQPANHQPKNTAPSISDLIPNQSNSFTLLLVMLFLIVVLLLVIVIVLIATGLMPGTEDGGFLLHQLI